MRLYLIEPYRSPDRRAVVAAPSVEAACRKVGVDPHAARVKDQTRFLLKAGRRAAPFLPHEEASR